MYDDLVALDRLREGFEHNGRQARWSAIVR